ncbi:MAG: Rrf2 family transcriptional regulator [Pseudomonadota bacterium]
MNKMNRKVEYALIALKHMSSKTPGELTSAKEVVEATGVPFDATARVMQQMAQAGLLRSEQGARGGYSIIKDLSKANFHDLIEVILGPTGISKCIHGECELIARCNIVNPVSVLNRKLIDFYKSVSLKELLKIKEAQSTEVPRSGEVSQ